MAAKGGLICYPLQQQYNSHHPYGLNDGAIIPARGYQTIMSAGIFAKYGPISIQLRPEMIYAQNKEYDGFSQKHSAEVWAKYYQTYLNKIDRPERFGKDAYHKILWGQSSVRINVGPASVGLSNENLWWGPGTNNSLVMTNSAGGFKHITLNTTRPVRTYIGSFEAQLIAGRLNNSGLPPSDTGRVYKGAKLFVPKPDDWRYINVGVITYQPKWIPGLFLGLTRSFVINNRDLGKGLSDYLPIFIAFPKGSLPGKSLGENLKKRDQLSSVFARWILLKEQAEIYFEHGRNDHGYDLRDLFLEPEHSRAYVVGLNKIFRLQNSKDKIIQINVELTQLSISVASTIRPVESWYSHYQVKDGYTNRGQLMGSGLGPGGNMQSFDIRLIHNLNTFGFKMERIVNNNDFHYLAIKGANAHWVDLGFSLFVQKDFKNILLNAKVLSLKSLNYQHLYEPQFEKINDPWIPGKNVFNFQAQLGVSYKF